MSRVEVKAFFLFCRLYPSLELDTKDDSPVSTASSASSPASTLNLCWQKEQLDSEIPSADSPTNLGAKTSPLTSLTKTTPSGYVTLPEQKTAPTTSFASKPQPTSVDDPKYSKVTVMPQTLH